MKEFKRYKYGSPEVLKLEEVKLPAPGGSQILVKVHAISINPAEWHILRGKIWVIRLVNGLFKPKHQILGGDIAGEVVEIGAKVTHIKVGDRVFGRADHTALGEYALLDDTKCAIIPSNMSYIKAASLPLASITAFEALDQCEAMGKGHKVLINGASGGIGTLAVQIAKSRGAVVHAICSEKNQGLVRELGADQVIDYMKDDFLDLSVKYDLIIDLVGNLNLPKSISLMKENGTFVMVGYIDYKALCSFMAMSIMTKSKKLVSINAETTRDKLNRIGEMVASGKIEAVIDQIYDFESIKKAFEHLGSRRARGKIVIRLSTK